MPGANTTITARGALATIVHARYGRHITGTLWGKISPAGPPPDGLRSDDADDWQITLERAGELMAMEGYDLGTIDLGQAEKVRAEKLVKSIGLLVSLSSRRQLAPRPPRANTMTVLLGTAVVLAVAWAFADRRLQRGGHAR